MGEAKKECLEIASGLVTGDRAETYGPPGLNFERQAALFAVIAECADPQARMALFNICIKVARLIHSPRHLDSWIDIAGYAACGYEVAKGGGNES